MTLIGDFIGTYRIIALPFQDPFCELLVAEQTEPVWFIYCPGVALETQEEKDEFARKAGRSIQHNGVTIPVRQFGVVSTHPYFTATYTEQIQQVLLEYVKLISLALQATREQQPGDQHALFLTLMRVIGDSTGGQKAPSSAANDKTGATTAGTGKYDSGQTFSSRRNRSTPRRRRSAFARGSYRLKKWHQGILIAILLIILVASGMLLYTIIPAAHATVTVTPVQKNLEQTYTLTVGSDQQDDPTLVSGRSIIFTSPQRSQTISATGQGVHPATMGQGQVILSQIHLTTILGGPRSLAISSVSDGQGRTIVTDETPTLVEGGTLILKAHAEPAGSFSNIPAHDIDGPVDIVDEQTSSPIGTGYIANDAGFSGGHEAVNFTYVKQTDIDNVSRTLSNQLTSGTRDRVKKGVAKDEHLIHDVQCTSTPSSNHKANDEATQVTVTLSVTCQTVVYTDKMLHDQAVKLYQNQGQNSFGRDYGVAGDMVVSQPAAINSATFRINVKGIWSYLYTSDRIAAIKQMISGKSKQNALQLLQDRRDMQTVKLETNGGLGSSVPKELNNINVIINKVHGLSP